ncbi:DUF3969 family protein [Myxococcus hansupus]|uniref:DUF3969 family protein n=1 Tax=Pseudomyxococcus hansupus TaxID=1297742 RepID=UPI001D036225|nr:DUF3969 family protein [Myxococcus hansupus]
MELSFLAAGEVEVQQMVAIAALGMCRALAAGAVTPGYACGRLFGPALLSRLDVLNAHPELVRAIHLATELEDLSELAPESMGSSIAEIEACLLRVLSVLPPSPTVGAKWLVK